MSHNNFIAKAKLESCFSKLYYDEPMYINRATNFKILVHSLDTSLRDKLLRMRFKSNGSHGFPSRFLPKTGKVLSPEIPTDKFCFLFNIDSPHQTKRCTVYSWTVCLRLFRTRKLSFDIFGARQRIIMTDVDINDKIEEEDPQLTRLLSRLSKYLETQGLTPFSSKVAIGFMRSRLQQDGGQARLERVIGYLLGQLNGGNRKHFAEDNTEPEEKNWQMGCPNVIPGLRPIPIWDIHTEFTWIDRLQASYADIVQEFLNLRGTDAFQPYRSPVSSSSTTDEDGTDTATPPVDVFNVVKQNASDALGQLATDSGSWNVSYLHLHGLDFSENLDLCPKTAAVINEIFPRHYHHSFFSALSPGTHITPHYGPTNKKLRCHFPLFVPKDKAWLRVADRKVYLEEGVPVIFDDSFEHEAGNDDSESPRVVLIVDFWHPDLTDEEVKFLGFINKGQMNAAKRLQAREAASGRGDKEDGVAEGTDFMSVIMRAKSQQVAEEVIWPYAVKDD